MAFDLYRDSTLGKLLNSFSTLEEALAQLGRNRALVLDSNAVFTKPITINDYKTSIFLNSSFAHINLGEDAGVFHIYGDWAATVRTSTAGGSLWGSGGDNLLIGNDGRDVMRGEDGNDILAGHGGNDILFGGAGNDWISGGSGRNALHGGDGQDILIATEGVNNLWGDAGADSFHVNLSAASRTVIYDFSVNDGDTLVISGIEGVFSLSELMAQAEVFQQNGYTYIRNDGSIILLRDVNMADLTDTVLTIEHQPDTGFGSFNAFLASGQADSVTEVAINGTIYHLRDGEPLHEGHKYADDSGRWWSPDYFVLVAAGQSNMVGAGVGGDFSMNGNVVAYDWVNDELVLADYGVAPAGGLGVRTGTSLRNNLYFSLANHLAETLDQPVLVIARPVSGSSIVSWIEDALNQGSGSLFTNLSTDIADALAMIGQSQIDLFTWLQGESDYPVANETYKQYVLTLLDQIHTSDWGASETAILIGELSREGVNFAQNRVFQEIEMSETDPNLGFVSSTGLHAFDEFGIHFDGQSLVEYGYQRFWAEYQNILAERANPGSTATGNTAPQVVTQSEPVQLIMTVGDEVRIDVSSFFTDAENDPMWFYAYLDQRGIYMDTSLGNEIIFRPGFDHAGTYTFHVYASDYYLDSANINISVTVLDGTPHLTSFSNSSFTTQIGAYSTLAMAMQDLKANRGLEILDQTVLSADSPNMITIDTLHITGAAGISGTLTLAEGLLRGYVYGQADFNLDGNSTNNRLQGNDGENQLAGMAGDDQIYGGAGDDILFGGTGNDRLFGDDGQDILNAGSGKDQVWGGLGADTFYFALGDERTLLRDFNYDTEGDHIVLTGLAGITDFTSFLATADFRDSDGRLIVDFPGDQLIIYGVTTVQLSADMFTFA